jgi:hypothetical protein
MKSLFLLVPKKLLEQQNVSFSASSEIIPWWILSQMMTSMTDVENPDSNKNTSFLLPLQRRLVEYPFCWIGSRTRLDRMRPTSVLYYSNIRVGGEHMYGASVLFCSNLKHTGSSMMPREFFSAQNSKQIASTTCRESPLLLNTLAVAYMTTKK